MSRHYEGLMIGGPYAGRSIVGDTQTMTVWVTAPRFSFHSPQPEPTEHIYRWVHTGQLGLWIHSTLDLRAAILEMANAYTREQIALAKAAKSGSPPHPQGGQSPFDGTTSHID